MGFLNNYGQGAQAFTQRLIGTRTALAEEERRKQEAEMVNKLRQITLDKELRDVAVGQKLRDMLMGFGGLDGATAPPTATQSPMERTDSYWPTGATTGMMGSPPAPVQASPAPTHASPLDSMFGRKMLSDAQMMQAIGLLAEISPEKALTAVLARDKVDDATLYRWIALQQQLAFKYHQEGKRDERLDKSNAVKIEIQGMKDAHRGSGAGQQAQKVYKDPISGDIFAIDKNGQEVWRRPRAFTPREEDPIKELMKEALKKKKPKSVLTDTPNGPKTYRYDPKTGTLK